MEREDFQHLHFK